METRARELSRKSLETFVLRSIGQVAMTITGIVIARALGPSGKGSYAYALTILTLLLTLSSGQSAAISRQYGRRRMPSSDVYAAMLRLMFLVAVPLSLIVAGAGWFRHDLAMAAAGLVLPFAYLNQTTLAFFMSDGKVRWTNVQGLLTSVLFACAVAAAVFLFHAGIAAVLAVWVGTYAIVSVRSWFAARPYARGPVDRRGVWGVFRDQVGFTVKSMLNQLLQSLNFQIDLFIILYFLGSASLGIYSTAVGIGQLTWILSRPIAVASYGRVVSGSKAESAYLTAVCLRHALLIVGAICIALFVAGPTLITLVYGAKFAGAGLAMRVILPGIVAYCALPFYGQFFSLQLGRPGIMTIAAASSTIVCAAVTILLIPRFGIVAGSIGTSLSYCASCAFMAYLFWRETKISPWFVVQYSRSDFKHYDDLLRSTVASAVRLLQWRSA